MSNMKLEHSEKYNSRYINPSVVEDLTVLLNTQKERIYQAAMLSLGKHLGRAILKENNTDSLGQVLVVSTAEDADYLTQGLIDSLFPEPDSYKLAVFWNHHYSLSSGESVAPIVNKYIDAEYSNCKTIILMKSIISGSCVVKTNLIEVINTMINVERIVVASPVMHVDAEKNLKAEFTQDISSKFKFVYFRTDNDKQNGMVLPGIGGEIYPKLGLSNQPVLLEEGYLPQIVEKHIYAY